MKRVAIYGADVTGQKILKTICDTCTVVCFVDGNQLKIGGGIRNRCHWSKRSAASECRRDNSCDAVVPV